jgi:hypothetical protein
MYPETFPACIQRLVFNVGTSAGSVKCVVPALAVNYSIFTLAAVYSMKRTVHAEIRCRT